MAKKDQNEDEGIEEEELMFIRKALEQETKGKETESEKEEKEGKGAKAAANEKEAEETALAEERREKLTELESYSFDANGIPVTIKIGRKASDYVPQYIISIPMLAEGTKLILNAIKGDLITQVKLDISELTDPKKGKEVRSKFERKANELLERQFHGLTPEKRQVLISYLIQNTLGLGDLEVLMADENLEDVAINNPMDPVWVYHKRHGWCRTNLFIRRDETVYEYAAMVGRKIGRQINVLNPIMNAHLPSGDRINVSIGGVGNRFGPRRRPI